ncbi:phosphohydrolase [Desulforhopalus sp. 52FAK]
MKCPGQDMKYWKDDAIFDVNCPECDGVVEFYKDDTSRKCHTCGHRFVNPKLDFGCASYCQFAEQCLGTLPENFLGSREDLLKDKVAVLLKRHLKTDFKRIREATELAQLGENICKQEGGNLAVVLCASYLHGVEKPAADGILNEAGASEPLVEIIYETLTPDTLAASSPIETLIVADAMKLYALMTALKQQPTVSPVILSEHQLHTATAKKILSELTQ